MLLLAWQTVRARKAGFAGAFTALSFALVLTAACGVLLESALRAGTPTERYAAAPVVIGGSTRMADVDPLIGQLAALPGAGTAAPEVSFPAAVITESGQILSGPQGGASLGHSWTSAVLAPFELTSGHPPTGPDEVVLDSATAARGGLKPGDTVRLATTTAPRAYTVAGLASPPRKLARQTVLFFSPDQAARLAGTTRGADAIGITARDGADPRALAAQAEQVLAETFPATGTELWSGPWVNTGAQRGEWEFSNTPGPGDGLASLAGTVGILSLLISVFVVAGALALTVQQRLREMALLRAVGATSGQVRRMIAMETLVLTIGAALVGCPVGVGVASLLRGALVDRGVVRSDVPLHVGPTALLTVVGGVVVTAQLAVWASARRASRVEPTQALRESSAPAPRIGWVRAVLGAGTLAVCAVVLSSSTGSRSGAGTAESMVLLLLLGVALLGPVIGRVASVVIGGPVGRLFPVAGFLASAALRTQPRRFAAAVTPLALAVAFTSTVLFVPGVKAQAAVTEDGRRLRADHVVQADGIGLPPDFVAAARRLPGVKAVSGVVPTMTMVSAASPGTAGSQGIDAQVVDPQDLSELLEPGVTAGSLAQLRGDGVALGQRSASALDAGVGTEVRIGWPDGTESIATVVAVYDRDLRFADALLPTEFAAAHTPNFLAPTVLVRSAPDADPQQVGRELQNLASAYPMARTSDRATYDNARRHRQESATAVGRLLLGMISLFTAIAVVNTLVMATTERLREFALLRLVGTTRRQILRMMAWEGGITVGVALVLGAAVTAAVLVPVSLALTGSAWPSVPAAWAAAVLGGAALLGLGTVLLTTRLALRREPVEAMGLRE
ncbi:putative ABC transport system permease protein [Kitasatospora sp. MAA19]|uniref:ABC transporter permease n=1 Tax=Kitasatospora sp. MAA19 TaxID=3035090 RepID=UPI0024764810|nr:ABC transporter permease [Kitasatospora sp. MAA19]MDH6703538.1 putative ABC transport system permease protein [Kitasatospora sp. MAA19]